MPNGGSDCCGTCWFNARQFAKELKPGGDRVSNIRSALQGHFCTIRGLAIRDPFGTYCGNHPQRRPDRDPIPIGPVFVGEKDEIIGSALVSGGRKVSHPSPDTEEVRLHLLELLRGIGEQPPREYPPDRIVVWQLGEFREVRAVGGLQRVAAFDRDNRPDLVAAAQEALSKMP